jgi:hypothetical protein
MTFHIGDRVKYHPPRPALFSCLHGQVVYRHGKHDPRNPRVRWQSGWGTTVPAAELALLTPAEAAALPPVQTVSCD